MLHTQSTLPGWNFDNSYTLPTKLYVHQNAASHHEPMLAILNHGLPERLGLDAQFLANGEVLREE